MGIFNKNKIIVKIGGMSCSHCAKRVNDALIENDGIKAVKVNLDRSCAVVTFDGNIDYDLIKDKIISLDYEFLGIEEV